MNDICFKLVGINNRQFRGARSSLRGGMLGGADPIKKGSHDVLFESLPVAIAVCLCPK